MGYKEAIEDGIRIVDGYRRNGKFCPTSYYPPCIYCGTPVYSWSYRRGIKYTCLKCKNEHKTRSRTKGDAGNAQRK